MKYKALLIIPAIFWLTVASADQVNDIRSIKMQSGSSTVAVLELYTSEGCYNCPAAERYLKEITEKYAEKKQFIPLAFHVDYWDYIGWEDPFADPAYGERQRGIAQRNKLNSLYTPQFVIYGKDFPAFQNIPEAISIVNDIKPRVDIDINATLKTDHKLDSVISIRARDAHAMQYANIFIALSEDNLSSKITEGENEGLLLQHDHVVRKFIGPFTLEGKDNLDIKQEINIDKQWKLADLSLVVFAQDSIDGTTHQAIRVPLNKLKTN
jgi:hypothetical protein